MGLGITTADQLRRMIAPTVIERNDYPPYFALIEDEPLKNGGRHWYGFRTLTCEWHVGAGETSLKLRKGCGRIAAMAIQRMDKARQYFERQRRYAMDHNLGLDYLAHPFDPEEGDWLPSWYPTTSERWSPWSEAVHIIRGISKAELEAAIAQATRRAGSPPEWITDIWLG